MIENKATNFPRISFVMIVLNGMPFIEAALKAIYDQAHQIVIVEGAVEKCRFAATDAGGSIDGTVDCLERFPDPLQKIELIRGLWPEKLEMQNKALEYVNGDYIWLVDADEVYKESDIIRIKDMLAEDSSISQINFIPDNFWKGFDSLFVSDLFFEEPCHYRRVFKFTPGSYFTTHRPPTLFNPEENCTTDQIHLISGAETREMGVWFYHYSYVCWEQVYQKIELYHRYGWGEQWDVDLDEWFRECFLRWTPENSKIVEAEYPVWAGDKSSRTEKFSGDHPDAIKGVVETFVEKYQGHVGGVPEDVALQVVGSPFYQKKTREAWSLINLDAPLAKRDKVLEENIETNRPFWNIHVALNFMASTIKPLRYLEVGVRSGGSLVQVLNSSRPIEVYAVDMWEGSYAGMPNTLNFTKQQFVDYADRVGGCSPIAYFRGSSHKELKKFISKGLTFDLINIDGDHTQEGAWEDLEDAIRLLNRRGAIVFDDITHPAHGDLLTLAYRLKFRYPEFSVLLNTSQENGCAIFLRGISFDELVASSQVLQGNTVRVAGEEEQEQDKNLTMISEDSAFAWEIRALLDKIKPRSVIESGTYHGTGTTKVIAEWFSRNRIEGKRFYSIECNLHNLEQARINLEKENLLEHVTLVHGISVPRELLPSIGLIREKFVDNIENKNIFIDHKSSVRAKLYHKETEQSALPEDCLGDCLDKVSGSPDFVLLDSGGHLGNTEFNHLLEHLTAECYLALDDTKHVKHNRSLRQIMKDPRFELIKTSDEKFGFCLAKFTPTCVAGAEAPVRILWLRTDSIGDNVLSFPLLSKVKEIYRNSWITVLCQAHIAELYHACPFVDEVLTFERRRAQIDEQYCRVVVERLQVLKADLCINPVFSRERITDLFALGSRSHRRLAFFGNDWNVQQDLWRLHNRYYSELVHSGQSSLNEREHYQSFFQSLGGAGELSGPVVWWLPEDETFAQRVFEDNGFDPAKTVVLFAGAQGGQRLSSAYGPALRTFCREHKYSLIALGGLQDKEINQHNLEEAGCHSLNLCGQTSLRQAAAILKKSAMAVGAETGLAHIAAAVDIPHVILLGGGHFGRFMPYSPKTTAVSLPLDCFGCEWNCQYSEPFCVSSISPEIITEALRLTVDRDEEQPALVLQGKSCWQTGGDLPTWGGVDICRTSVSPSVVIVERGGVQQRVSPPPVERSAADSSEEGSSLFDKKSYDTFLAHHRMNFSVHPIKVFFFSWSMAKLEGRSFFSVLNRAVQYYRKWLIGAGND